MSLPPYAKYRTAGNSTQLSYHPELNASWKLSPVLDGSRIARTVALSDLLTTAPRTSLTGASS